MSDSNPNADEARAALEAMRSTQAQLASLADCPPWRHAAFGAVMGLLVLSMAFSQPLQAAMFVVAMAGVALIARNDRKRYGVFVNGYRAGATLPLTLGLLASMLGLIALQVWLKQAGAEVWWGVAVGAVAFGIGVGASLWWNRIFRREMEGGG